MNERPSDSDLDRVANADGSADGTETRITVPCYEGPEGRGPGVLELNEDALVRHIFIGGATGSGKTTLIRVLMRQLMAAHASDPERKVGLLILDGKGDETVEFVRAAAAKVGRSSDVLVLSLDGDASYDFFGDLETIDQANEFADRLLFGCGAMTAHDVFWGEYRRNLLTAALVWLTARHLPRRSFTHWISHASAWLLSERLTEEQRHDLEELRGVAKALPEGTADRIALDHTIHLIEEWDGVLDHRTRGNARATLANALAPLLRAPALRLFRSDAPKAFRVADAVEKGAIMVVSVSSVLHATLANLIHRCVRTDLFRSVITRKPGGRLVMCIADEFQLVTTCGESLHDDATMLPVLRSFRAGVIAGAPGLGALDRVLGPLNRRIVLGAFNTVLLLRSTEAALHEWAEEICGTVEETVTIREQSGDLRAGGIFTDHIERRITQRVRRPVCSRGALARLEPGQAYLVRHSGECTPHPLWIAAEAT